MGSRARTTTVHAPAKINLSLHVVGRRADGYHLLDGLVVFTELGDQLTISPAEADRLTLDGPLAAGVPIDGNIVMKALALARGIARETGVDLAPLALALTKKLPSAAGIGGGSADAAALLRHLCARHPALLGPLTRSAGRLGADVPMCLARTPARIAGVGNIVEPLASMPPLDMVLVNPRVAIPTPAIFSRLLEAHNSPPPPVPVRGFGDLDDVLDFLAFCRNDLFDPAVSFAPVLAQVKSCLTDQGARLSRMSGSGATVFGLFGMATDAAKAAETIAREHPDWWVVATRSFGSTAEKGTR